MNKTTIRNSLKFGRACTVVAVVALILTSCGSNTTGQHNKKEAHSQAGIPAECPEITPGVHCTDTSFNNQVSAIFKTYLEIQTALAQDQDREAAAAAGRLNVLMSQYGTTTLPDSLKRAYDERATGIITGAGSIAQSHDIAQQRKAFETLSGYVSGLLSTFGTDRPVYETHCPMAFDDKGASWLSDKTEVRNPYFGDQMLECGDVIRVIKARH